MSHKLAICVPPISADDKVAWGELDAMIEAQGPVPEVFKQLHDLLTARFPCICTLPDDKVDDGLWADGPLWDNFGHRAAVLAMVHSKAHEGTPFIIEQANTLGLTVFDWAGPTIHRPPLAPVARQAPKVVGPGYCLHITRRADWRDASSGPPITRAEFNQHFRDRPELYGLRFVTRDRLRFWIMPHTPMDIFVFVRPGGEIVRGLPSQDRLPAIVEAARAIGARVVGDNGEEYGPDTPLLVEAPESNRVSAWRRFERVLGVWIVIGAFFGAIAMGVWGVIYFFWYT